jgi:hypothetical protein
MKISLVMRMMETVIKKKHQLIRLLKKLEKRRRQRRKLRKPCLKYTTALVAPLRTQPETQCVPFVIPLVHQWN